VVKLVWGGFGWTRSQIINCLNLLPVSRLPSFLSSPASSKQMRLPFPSRLHELKDSILSELDAFPFLWDGLMKHFTSKIFPHLRPPSALNSTVYRRLVCNLNLKNYFEI
jgi:hypothetical protein